MGKRRHINKQKLLKVCNAKTEDSCPFLRHFASDAEYEAYIEQQEALALAGKSTPKPPPPPWFPLDDGWDRATRLAVIESIERLVIIEQHKGADADDALIDRLIGYTNQLEVLRADDDSDDARVLKFLGNHLVRDEYDRRENKTFYGQGQQRIAPMVRAVCADLGHVVVAESQPRTQAILSGFSVDDSTGVVRAEVVTLAYAYAMHDEYQVVRDGRWGTRGAPRYHAVRRSYRVEACDWPRCGRSQHFARYEDALVELYRHPPMTKKEKDEQKVMLEALPTPDQRDGHDTSTQVDCTVAQFGVDDPNRVLVGQLYAGTGQETETAAYRDQLREVERQGFRARRSRLAMVEDRDRAAHRYQRSLAWTGYFADRHPDAQTRVLMGRLHRTLTVNPPGVGQPGRPGVLPGTLAMIDQEIEYCGGPPVRVPTMERYAAKKNVPIREYAETVNTYFQQAPAPPGGYNGFVMVDTEVSDLNEGNGEIIEVGLAYMDPTGRPIARRSWIVKPERHGGFVGMTSLHRIDKPMTANAPGQAETARELHRMLDGWIPVAHNANFDKAHVDTLLDRHALPRTGLWIDSIAMYGGHLEAKGETGRSKRDLKTMAGEYGIPFSEAHHAASSDVTAAGYCFQQLLPTAQFNIPFQHGVVQPPASRYTPSPITRGDDQARLDDELWSFWTTRAHPA